MLFRSGTVLGAPIYVALGGAALLLFALDDEPIAAVAAETVRLMKSPIMPTVPLFTFTGFLLPGYFKALICIKRNKNADAIKFLTIEINEIEKLNIRREVLKELKLLSEVYKNIADYHNAVLTMERYNLINQTLIDEEMRIRDKSYEIEQSLNEQEKKMTVLEAENSFRTQSNYYLLGVLFLIAISTIAIFNRYLGKKNLTSI